MGRRFKPGRRKGGGGLGWILGFVCLVMGISAGGAGLAWFVQSRTVVDAHTLCPEAGPIAREIVLLDLTDPLTQVQARRLRGLIVDRVDQARQGTLVALAAVSDQSLPIFARCKPQAGEGANVLYENPRLIAEQFSQAFSDPLAAMLDAAMDTPTQSKSPVLETLQDVLSQLPGAFAPTRVTLVSDLLQNSPLLSVYRGEGWPQFAAAGHAQRLSGALSGAQVDVIRLPRPDAGQQTLDIAEAFWIRYLDAQGVAAPPRVTLLGDL